MTDKKKPAAPAGGAGWWVRIQHDEVKVLHQADQPETQVKDGERLATALGPFASEEAATKYADKVRARTLKHRTGLTGEA